MKDNALVTTAFIGTAQRSSEGMTAGTMAVDELAQGLEGRDTEQKLLLIAGVRSVYLQAGRIAEILTSSIQSCEPEILPSCIPSIAKYVESMLEGSFDMLPMTLERLGSAGQRVPHTLVEALLSVKNADLHPVIYPVLGKRGIWLSQFNPTWSWIFKYQLEEQGIEAVEAERLWQEGSEEQRVALLEYLRKHDVATARQWLLDVWSQEKADTRGKCIATLQVNLSIDDEPFLENALDDRASSVRTTASQFLLQLPASALSKRMQEHGDAMLGYSNGALTIHLLEKLPKDWIRDGIPLKSEMIRLAQNAWWFSQVLAKIPPSHWEEHFGLSINNLLAALDPEEKLYEILVTAWFKAADLYGDTRWCLALWDYGRKRNMRVNTIFASLLSHMFQDDAERRVLTLIREAASFEDHWYAALLELPEPWSKKFSEVYLQHLRSHLATLELTSYPGGDSWYQSMKRAALALSTHSFAQALKPMVLAELPVNLSHQAYLRHYWEREISSFVDTIHARQRIIEEIR